MSDLAARKCKPMEGGSALSADDARGLLEQIGGWTLAGDAKLISRTFEFKNYYRTMAFVNAVAWIAHAEDHHPDMEIGYNRCSVHFSTHSVGGLSENDFICAARIDHLLQS
jgi:4a-hydroxytetrahydrobiopterin dehydratase